MMMVLKKILHSLTIRSKLRNAHIINKSSIVHRPSSMATAFSHAFALGNGLNESGDDFLGTRVGEWVFIP